MEILWPERETKDVESAFQHIEHQELITAYLDKWGSEQKQ